MIAYLSIISITNGISLSTICLVRISWCSPCSTAVSIAGSILLVNTCLRITMRCAYHPRSIYLLICSLACVHKKHDENRKQNSRNLASYLSTYNDKSPETEYVNDYLTIPTPPHPDHRRYILETEADGDRHRKESKTKKKYWEILRILLVDSYTLGAMTRCAGILSISCV